MRPRPLTPPKKKRKISRKPVLLTLLAAVIASTYTAIAVAQPLAQLEPVAKQSELNITTPASNLPWPGYGSGAVGLSDGTIVATHGEQKPMSIASVNKVILSLVMLERHPIKPGEEGPAITLTQEYADLYSYYISINGSVMPVREGQEITLRDMIVGLMLPSANNVADTLALWEFGSLEAYFTYANDYLQRKGLTNTHVGGDASGYSAESVSTATDLVKLGGMAMNNPVLREISSQSTATIPVTGTVRNYNSLLGRDGIIGLKTGNNDANGGVFVGATTAEVNGKTVTLITALGGAPTLGTVLRDSGTLLAAFRTTFADTTIVSKGAVLGTYEQYDGSRIQAIAAQNLSLNVLRGTAVTANVKLQNIGMTASAGQTVGSVQVSAGEYYAAQSVPIILKQAPVQPDIWWRLTNPSFDF